MAVAERAAGEHTGAAARHRILVQPDVAALVGEWDGARLERVLDNLVSNAVKYSPNGGTISISLAQHGGPDGWAVVRVRDSGMGIPKADLPHLREAFRRGSNLDGAIPGSGVGLMGTRAIVEAHRGKLEFESREGVGTTVTVQLPRRPGRAEVDGGRAQPPSIADLSEIRGWDRSGTGTGQSRRRG